VVKDANNGGLSGQTVTFAATSGTLSASSATTDTSGSASVTFSTNSDKSNRTVTITAASGTAQSTTTVDVTGTAVALNGVSSAVVGATTSFTVALKDAANSPISGVTVALSSALGNPISSSVVTDASGSATVSYTASKGGTDTIIASALGASTSKSVTVSSVSFSFTALSSSNIAINTCQPITVNGGGFTTTPSFVNFTVTRGALHLVANCSDSPSQVTPAYLPATTVWVKSSSTGSATVTASALAADGQTSIATTSLPVNFVSTTPATITLQGTPTTVSVNGTSTLTALVRDAAGNPVEGKTVVFTTTSGGQVSPTTATTDSSGTATTTFTADSSSSGNSAVTVGASVLGYSSVSTTTTLTVSGLAVNIVLGTNNLLDLSADSIYYIKTFSVAVSDSNSSPVKNQKVTISLLGTGFYKGFWVAGTSSWSRVQNHYCDAEDKNNDGAITGTELGDVNGNGHYDPNGVALVMASTSATASPSVVVTTDGTGAATFYVKYPRNYASWVDVNVFATTTVLGLTGVGSSKFMLPILASEVSSTTTSPSFQVSPYGPGTGTGTAKPGCDGMD